MHAESAWELLMPQDRILPRDLRQGVAGSRYIPKVGCYKVTAVASECKANFPTVFFVQRKKPQTAHVRILRLEQAKRQKFKQPVRPRLSAATHDLQSCGRGFQNARALNPVWDLSPPHGPSRTCGCAPRPWQTPTRKIGSVHGTAEVQGPTINQGPPWN